jgi:glycosyltransferase involved in cell wall biosynthesis
LLFLFIYGFILSVIKLSFVISTLDDGVHNINLLPFRPDVEYIVVHQLVNGTEVSLFSSRPDVQYFVLSGKGLSRSRNFGIRQSSSEFCYLLDDDVLIIEDSLNSLIKYLTYSSPDVSRFKAITPSGADFGHYPAGPKKINLFDASKVNSIEICIKKELIINNNIYFDESFGLGTSQPSGEEFIFITDCQKNNLSISYYPLETVIHPEFSSGLDFFSTPEKIIAKKNMFVRVTGKKNSVLSLLFFLKKIPILLKTKSLFFFIKYYF